MVTLAVFVQINELDQEQEQIEATEQRRQAKVSELSRQMDILQAELDEANRQEGQQDVQPLIEENSRRTRNITQEMTILQQRDEQNTLEMRAAKPKIACEFLVKQ